MTIRNLEMGHKVRVTCHRREYEEENMRTHPQFSFHSLLLSGAFILAAAPVCTFGFGFTHQHGHQRVPPQLVRSSYPNASP